VNFYRLFAPIVDEALRRGWDVECWHDYTHTRIGQKAYNFPEVGTAPRFVHGAPRVLPYGGAPELPSLLKRTDAVVSLTPPSAELNGAGAAPATWLMLQHAMSNFIAYGAEGFLSSDAVGLYSDYWIDTSVEYFRARGLLEPGAQAERAIRERAVVVGFPEMEAARLVDPDAVRSRLRIPPGRPVVVLLPYSYGFGFASYRATHPAWTGNNRELLAPLARQLWADVRVARAIKAFCTRTGAHLIVKARLKRPPNFYTRTVADTTIYDESVYPATILEVLSIASLCIGFFSTAVHEAAYLGVPYLCVRPADREVRGDPAQQRIFLDRADAGFDVPGVSVVWETADVIRRLPRTPLGAFAMDPAARAAYVAKFLGYNDGHCSSRVLDALARVKTPA
jgi:hypothetical protein